MKAQNILLTHFSQRYPKIPVFDSIHHPTVSIAFDFMTATPHNISILPKLLPAIQLLFKEEEEEESKEETEESKPKPISKPTTRLPKEKKKG